MSLFRYDSPLAQFLVKMLDLIILNVLWIIACIPLVTIGASTTAMYSVMMKLVRGEEYTVLRQFFQSFKENFKQATAIWLMLLVSLLVLGANLYLGFYGNIEGTIMKLIAILISLLLTVLTALISLYVFPLQACFYNPVKQTIQNALILSLSNLPKTILMVLYDVAVIGVTVLLVPALSIFAGILIALGNAWLLKSVFAKYTNTEVIITDLDEGE